MISNLQLNKVPRKKSPYLCPGCITLTGTDLRSSLLLPSPVELDPDGPVVAEDAEVVPLLEMNLTGGPDHSHPGTAVKSEQK